MKFFRKTMPVLDAGYLVRWSPHPPIVLFADARETTRHEYTAFLEKSGCVVEEAEDGRVALARALTGRIDILIADTHLPGLDGAHLSQILRTDHATRTLPIVITGVEETDREQLRESGADVVLVGRPRPETLAIEMAQVLTMSAQLRERSAVARPDAQSHVRRGSDLIGRSLQLGRRLPMSRAHSRWYSQTPEIAPPTLVCPSCDKPLTYEYSHTGGVNAQQAEQWDYFVCSSGCGTFQFRHRTNKLRKMY